MREQEEYIWYACYGSNIQGDRFARYLSSCPDSSAPAEIRPYILPYPLYFAGKSRTWNNHASAYIDPSRSGKTLGKAYKIKRAQFESVHRQEGRNYSQIIALGTLEGLPIYTFTHENVHENRGIPDPSYFDIILDGLKPLYPEYSAYQLGAYIVDAMLSPVELQVLTTLRASEHKVSLAALKQTLAMESSTIRSSVEKLLAYPLIKQDRRTITFSFDDDEAAFYTLESKRTFIDRLLTIQREAEAELKAYACQEELITEIEIPEETETGSVEGRRRMVYSTQYERNPRNRMAAIRIHGTRCQACGFDFEAVYGELGRGYIEVHHIKPLHRLDEETQIDPRTDLVCLCSNCHRMIHHKRNQIMTVEELRAVICSSNSENA